VERIDDLIEEGNRLVAALRVNLAMGNHTALDAEWQQYQARLKRDPHAPAVATERGKARALEIVQRMAVQSDREVIIRPKGARPRPSTQGA
jgi:hypothetical protein